MWETSILIPFLPLVFSNLVLGNVTTSSCTFSNSTIPRGRPRVTSDYKIFYKNEGNRQLQMPCKVQSNPTANVQWLFNGKNITSLIKENHYSGPKPEVKCSRALSTLTLWNITQKSHQGSYTCVARNSLGESSYQFNLQILKPKAKTKKPSIINKTFKYTAYLGTSYNLTCQVLWPEKKPSSVTFYRQGKRVYDNNRQVLLPPSTEAWKNDPVAEYKMWITNVSMKDQGSWECRANYFGVYPSVSTNKTFELVVVPCPAGYYCPMNESSPRPCEYGTYSDGSTNITTRCKDCPDRYNLPTPNSGRPPAATSIQECPGTKSDVPCPAGYYCPMNESSPRPCEYGTYRDSTTNITTRCKDCPDRYNLPTPNSGRPPAATSIEECPGKTPDEKATTTESPNNQGINIYAVVGIVGAFIVVVPVVVFMIYKKKNRSITNPWRDDQIEPDKEIIYDVFISFSNEDHEFATIIRNKIEGQNYKCCYHHRDFSPGEYIVKNITDAIHQSTVTLVILSPDFMSSKYCKSELSQALTAALKSHRVLPVLYKPCKNLPREIRSCWTYLEYKAEDEKHFWKKLFDTIEKYCRRAKGVETNV